MKKSIAYLLIISIILISLVATNPSTYDFENYVKENTRKGIQTESSVGNFFANLASTIAGKGTSMVSNRKDYYIFSTYEVDLFGEKHTYIGFLKQFIRVQ